MIERGSRVALLESDLRRPSGAAADGERMMIPTVWLRCLDPSGSLSFSAARRVDARPLARRGLDTLRTDLRSGLGAYSRRFMNRGKLPNAERAGGGGEHALG